MPFPYTFPIAWENFPVAQGKIRSIYRHCGPGVFEMWFGFASHTRTSFGQVGGILPSFTPGEPIPKWAEEIKDVLFGHAKALDELNLRMPELQYSIDRQRWVEYFRVYTYPWRVIDKDTDLTTGDGKDTEPLPSGFDGMILIDADAHVDTASTSGTPTIQIHNLGTTATPKTNDMLSTRITIDINEKNSYTAATQPVIDTTKDDVVTGDILRADVDVAGVSTKGLVIILRFRKP